MASDEVDRDEVDRTRRRFLTQATSVVGGAGILAGAVPFVSSMQVSARAQAAGAPVEADVSKLEPGQRVTHEWRGKPVWIVRRTERMLDTLDTIEPRLADPDSSGSEQPPYCENKFRAREDPRDVLVMVGICTHLGCSPHVSARSRRAADLGRRVARRLLLPLSRLQVTTSGRPSPRGQPGTEQHARCRRYMFIDEQHPGHRRRARGGKRIGATIRRPGWTIASRSPRCCGST
ncbi:MAG: ubiquinol-cytochrome c reductase iron-sulfur subunit [Halofilum sp. (in: g-proteobacteria)]|nr:ubiquinol-cytochrome c reductase iron-sulfur subunit [Halofilum sp. (in: g-proteobacteria)]